MELALGSLAAGLPRKVFAVFRVRSVALVLTLFCGGGGPRNTFLSGIFFGFCSLADPWDKVNRCAGSEPGHG